MIADWGPDIYTMQAPTADLLADAYYSGASGIAGSLVTRAAAAEWASREAAALITGIDATTRRLAREIIADAMREPGITVDEVQARLMAAFETWSEWRAEMIARTEIARAAAAGDIAGFRSAGVRYVRITDGVLWDQPCVDANGAIWTVEEYEANPLQHPNCGRYATPYDEALA